VCKASSVSATVGSTTGTDFLELQVGWSAMFPEYQGHPGNDPHIVVISLSGFISCVSDTVFQVQSKFPSD
jgi:hypothetical protein